MKRRVRKNEAEFDPALVKWAGVIGLFALGLLLLFSAIGWGGFLGDELFFALRSFFGLVAYLLPLLILWGSVSLMFGRTFISLISGAGITLIVLSFMAFFGILAPELGGAFGVFTGGLLGDFFGIPGAMVLLVALGAIGLIISTDVIALMRGLQSGTLSASRFFSALSFPTFGQKKETENENMPLEKDLPQETYGMEDGASATPTVTVFNDTVHATGTKATAIPNFDAEYTAPPLSILGEDKGKPGTGDIKANANIIRRTFQNFGISVEMDEVSVGPTVTRYAIKPAEGVRLSKIVSLQNNLELALASHPVRIEAPIPGKSLVGIEVPNASKAMVGLGGILSSPEWVKSEKPLLGALGRDISGAPHYVNIAKMPHGLVAGATGSGKSVAIHTIITSLLYRNGPNQLRFIMVDPKRVELTAYNGIPHLLTPVITDPKKCIMALKWAAKEMERRYNILEAESVRDVDSYHRTVFEPAKKKGQADMPEALPFIVFVIDELADIMSSYPRELEAGIVRLAQMSRAVGIHLLLSTQRPSVNVITGLIKANVPTRMALQVASQIDSRTILDSGGAETLLGAGDMLYLSSDMQKPVRLQTAFISEGEVKKVVSYIKQHNAGTLNSLDLAQGGSGNEPNDAILLAGDDDVDDDLYAEAKVAVEEAGRASTSYLQRKLRIGYSRAARLMDLLEEKGVIGPADGSRPRDVLSRTEQGGRDEETEPL